MLAVRDTGIGMDAQTMSRVFEPFFTTKEHGKGTGLGLASAYGIVKQSGGYIWVVSEPGKGATFTIYLPPAVEADPSAVEPRIEGRIPSGAETVLLVEDEEAVLELAHEFLRGGGYTVLTARGPAEAMHIAQNHPGRIHALVADVVLPGTSGRALAGRLTALRPQMRVLYVSGHAEEAVVHHGVLSAGAAFLEKPFTRKTLLCKLREILDPVNGMALR
jgi:CheY-like chemotaxis protein